MNQKAGGETWTLPAHPCQTTQCTEYARRPREPMVNSANMADAVVRVEFESEYAALLTSCLHEDMFLIFRDLLQATGLPDPAMTTIILT